MNIVPKTSPARIEDFPWWCVWKSEIRDGKPTKVPYNPRTGQRARANNPSTFGTREEAETALTSGRYDGLGFLVDASLGITVIDLDGVVAEDGSLPGPIQDIVDASFTYTEVSPSGTGLHLSFGVADDVPRKNRASAICLAEAYTHGRFMTFTGNRLPGTPETFSGDIDALRRVLDSLGLAERKRETEPAAHTNGSAGSQENQDVLELAFNARNGDKIRRLFDGDISGYSSHSEADAAFVGFTSFYSQDPEQLKSWWRTSKLWRRKSERSDYADRTIKFVLDNHSGEVYTPPTPQASGSVTVGGKTSNADEPLPLPEVLVFPDVLPHTIHDHCLAGARSIGVPLEMLAVPALVFAGSVIGNAVELQLKAGWTVNSTLWAGVIGAPGEKKTPSLKLAQEPVSCLQKVAYDVYRELLNAYGDDLRVWNAKPKAERGDMPRPPTLDSLFTTDPTLEALIGIVNTCAGTAIIRDELSGFIASFDKYRGSGGDDRQQYLSLWACAAIKQDRKGGGTIYAHNPVAGIYGGIQPDLARNLHPKNGQRDGLVERFLLFRPTVTRRGWTEDEVDISLRDPVVNIYRQLRELRATFGKHSNECITVHLSPPARKQFIAWFNDNDERVERATGLRQGFYAKLDSQVARIALILHCLENHADPRPMVQEHTIENAIAVGEWFRSHLDRVLPLIGDQSRDEPVGLSARIVRILRMPDLQEGEGWVRRGRIIHKLGNVPSHDLTDTLRELQTTCVIESRTVESGTKPSEQWRICNTPHSKNSNNLRPIGPGSGDSSNSSNGYASQNETPPSNGKADLLEGEIDV